MSDTLRDTINRAVDSITRLPYPMLDVYRTADAVIIVTAPIDGLNPGSIEVSILGQDLIVQGETQPTEDIPQEAYLRRERRFDGFSRTVTIPVRVKAAEASAKVKNGVLTIRLPLADTDRSEIIDVQIAD